jgi:hypothetical protein
MAPHGQSGVLKSRACKLRTVVLDSIVTCSLGWSIYPRYGSRVLNVRIISLSEQRGNPDLEDYMYIHVRTILLAAPWLTFRCICYEERYVGLQLLIIVTVHSCDYVYGHRQETYLHTCGKSFYIQVE